MHEICFIICIHKILVEIHATPVVSFFFLCSEAKYEIWGYKKGEKTNKGLQLFHMCRNFYVMFICRLYLFDNIIHMVTYRD